MNFYSKLLIFLSTILLLVNCSDNVTDVEETQHGYTVTRITDPSESVHTGTFFNTTQNILYKINKGNGNELYTVDVNGGSKKLLLKVDGYVQGFPTITDDDTKIYFGVHKQTSNGPETSIQVINSDGTNLKIYNGVDGIYNVFDVSPNGNLIMFDRYHDMGNLVANSIWLFNVQTNQYKELTYGDNSIGVCFSPNGQSILMYSDKNSEKHFGYTMDLNGNILNKIELNGLDLAPIRFSKSGNKILCGTGTLNPYGNNQIIEQIVLTDGSGQNPQVINIPNSRNIPFDFFSDDQILFISRPDSLKQHTKSNMYKINSDGTNLIQLTNNDFIDFPQSISSDDKKILYYSSHDGDEGLYVLSVN